MRALPRRPLNPTERADRWYDLGALVAVAATACLVYWLVPV